MCILHPFCAAAWSFDKILKSPLSFDHASLLGSSRFCLRDWNSCSVPSFFVTPFSQIITPPSVTFDRNCCMICLSASPALPLPFSFFGSIVVSVCPSFWSKQYLFSLPLRASTLFPIMVRISSIISKNVSPNTCPGLLTPTSPFDFTASDQRWHSFS